MNRSVLVLDCGATNVKACLVDESGSVLSSFSEANLTKEDPFFKGGLIWDFQEIFEKLSRCIRKVLADSQDTKTIAVTATSFGVDGAVIGRDGSVIYPVISWQCNRTKESEQHLDQFLDRDWLYNETGLQSYHFNTINKMVWLKENRHEIFKDTGKFVLMPSLILWLLSGEMVTDSTMAGTTMLTSLKKRKFSDEIFWKLGLDMNSFPSLTEPGTVIGKLTKNAAVKLGLPVGLPVITSGHDTQFAIIGAGANVNEPVLSSGTWEILMARSLTEGLKMPTRKDGITIELDAVAGVADIGVQWVASGVTEWLGKMLFSDVNKGSNRYKTMIEEADKINPGADGVFMIPELFPGGFSEKKGKIEGFTHNTTRAHIYRSSLEALCFYARHAMEKLKKTGGFTPERLICVGGGAKNSLWNRLRASILNIPVHIPEVSEATALGAAIFSFTGLNVYRNVEEASSIMLKPDIHEFLPGNDSEVYNELFTQYQKQVFNS
jgi:L-fuculokinase